MKHTLFIVLILCLCLSFSGCGQNPAPKEREPETLGQTETNTLEEETGTASFQADTLEGESFSSEQLGEARLTMINVWATYCNPCLEEMPDLGEIAREYDSEDFQLIGIVSDVMAGDEEALAAAQELVEAAKADYPHLLLSQEVYEALLTEVSVVPTTFFLDEDGNLLDTVIGAQSGDAWRTMIDEYLETL